MEKLAALWSITAKNTDCSTGPLARPFARGKVNDWMAILSVFFSIFDHSAGGQMKKLADERTCFCSDFHS